MASSITSSAGLRKGSRGTIADADLDPLGHLQGGGGGGDRAGRSEVLDDPELVDAEFLEFARANGQSSSGGRAQ